MAASEKDVQDVIRTLIAEGIGEGEEGMRRIAETILNRAEQRGISPAEVVRQRAQYTGYSNPGPGAVQAMRDPNAITAAQAAWQMAQGPDDPTNGANHYWNPNIVNPSWARSMQSLGKFGNHAFATDMPNWQRPAPPVAPAPLMRSSGVNASQAMTSPSGGNGALQVALDQMATRERNRVTPASVEDRVTARNRVPTSVFGDDPMTPAQGAVVARIPSTPSRTPALQEAARRAALTMNQSYAGQDRAPAIQSGPTPRLINQAARTAALKATQSYVGQDRAPAPQSRSDTIGKMPSLAEMQATLGKPIGTQDVPSLYGDIYDGTLKARQEMTATPASPAVIGAPMGVATVLNTVDPFTGKPSTTPSRLPLAATSAKIAPVPLARPGGLMQASAPLALPRVSAPPLMAQSQQPLTIRVQGSNTIPVAPRTVIPAGPTAQQRVDFGNWATRNSGDSSSGSQAEAAQARSSGDGGRIRRY